MAGVFLSYSRADKVLAEHIIMELRALGVPVWWDEDMPGVDWQEELARQINVLDAVIVLWTPHSIASKNVKDEARLGQNTEKLVNVLHASPAPPFPFDRTNGLPLDGWNAREPHSGWQRLVQTLDDRLALSEGWRAGELMSAFQRRRLAIQERRDAVAAATDAYQTAKMEEDRAAGGDNAAAAAFLAAEEQLRRVVEMRGTPALTRAAQTELDACLDARREANRARSAAADGLLTASRAMARAQAELEQLFRLSAASPVPPPAPSAMPGPAASVEGRLPGEDERPLATPPGPAPRVGGDQPIEGFPQPAEPLPASRPPRDAVPNVAPLAEPVEVPAPGASVSKPLGGPDPARSSPAPLPPPHSAVSASSPAQGRSRRLPRVAIASVVAALAIGAAGWLLVPGLTYQWGDQALGRNDYSTAFYWLTISAQRGNRGAAWELGYMYLLGQGRPVDTGKAIDWLSKSATEGDVSAMLSLAEVYDGATRIPQNEAMARYWYQQAASRGVSEASDWLARHPQ